MPKPEDLADSLDRLTKATEELLKKRHDNDLPEALKSWGQDFLDKMSQDLADARRIGGAAGAKKEREIASQVQGYGKDLADQKMNVNGQEVWKSGNKVQDWATQRLSDIAQRLGGKAGGAAGGDVGAFGVRAGASLGVEAAGALGAAAAPVAILLAAAVALKVFHDAVVQAAKAQQQHNFQYANNSSAMAAVAVQTEIADAFRDRKIGDATAGTAQQLATANTNYDNTAAQFEILWSNIKNMGLASALNAITAILEPMGEVAQNVNKWVTGNNPVESEDMAKMFDETAKRVEREKAAGRDWFTRRF